MKEKETSISELPDYTPREGFQPKKPIRKPKWKRQLQASHAVKERIRRNGK